MALIRLKRGITAGFIPTGLTFGEPTVNTTDGILYCGNTAGETVDMSGVLSFNGKTGHVLFSQIDDDLTMNVTGLSASSGITSNGILAIAESLIHAGDPNTGFNFTADKIIGHAGSATDEASFELGATHRVKLGDYEGVGNATSIDINPSTDIITINGVSQVQTLQTQTGIAHQGDTDTKLTFGTNSISMQAGNVEFLNSAGTGGAIFPQGLSASAPAVFHGGISLGGGTDIEFLSNAGVKFIQDDDTVIEFNHDNGYLRLKTFAVQIEQHLQHLNDSDTSLEFKTDEINLQAGGVEFLHSTGTGGLQMPAGLSTSGTSQLHGGVTFGNDIYMGGDYHFRNEEGESLIDFFGGRNLKLGDNDSAGNDTQIYIRDSHNYISVAASTEIALESPNVTIPDSLTHHNDPNTKLTFDTDTISLLAGGVTFAAGISGGLSIPVGISASGDLQVGGNIVLPEDGVIQIGGDTEKIVFNGAGTGSSSIDISVGMVDFGNGSGCKLRSSGDSGTMIEFRNDTYGSDDDGFFLVQDGTDVLEIKDTGLSAAGRSSFNGSVAEAVNAVGSVNSNTAVDFSAGNVQTVTVAGNCEFSFSNPPASGNAGTVTLIVTNGGAHTVTFASAVKWPSDVAPSLTTSGVDVISFLTTDAGTNIYGFVGGLNFS